VASQKQPQPAPHSFERASQAALKKTLGEATASPITPPSVKESLRRVRRDVR
jgi:hypothetical protein